MGWMRLVGFLVGGVELGGWLWVVNKHAVFHPPRYPQVLVIPKYPSFSSVSVRCRRAFSFSGGLPDTCVLGNLPKTGTGFAEVHASLREIPEGDEKYGR